MAVGTPRDSGSWTNIEAPPGDGMGGRREQIRRMNDGEMLVQMRERIAAADGAMTWQREKIDAWREYHTEHYTEDDEEAARSQVVVSATGVEQLVPPQALLIADKITGPAEEYVAKYRESDLSVRFESRSRATPSENVAAFNGLQRRFDSDGGMGEVEINAFRDAVLYGLGAFGYETRYVAEDVDPGGKADVGAWDQTLVPKRIDRPEWSVLWDPASLREDRSDAEWAAHRTIIPRTDFERLYPDVKLADGLWQGAVEVQQAGTGNAGGVGFDPWYRNNAGVEEVAVVEYYRVVRKPAEVRMVLGEARLVEDPEKDEPEPEDVDPAAADAPDGRKVKPVAPVGKRRPIDVRRVERVLACGDYVLERTWVPGNVIPIVPVYGHRFSSEDRGVWYAGLVYFAADLNKAFENVLSDAVNYLARMSKVVVIGPEGFTSADPEGWADLSVPRWFLEYAMPQSYLGQTGTQGQPPTPVQIAIQVQGHLETMRAVTEEIARETGTLDLPAQGESAHDRSAQSIVRLNAVGNARHAVFLRNMAVISLMRKGQILARMIPAVFDRPGREEWIKGARPGDKDRPIFIKAPFVETDDGPRLVPCPHCGGEGKLGGRIDPACKGHGFAWGDDLRNLLETKDYQGKTVHYIDLAAGALDATVAIGSKEKTSRTEAVNTLATLIERQVIPANISADQLVAILSGPLPELGVIVDRLQRANPQMHDDQDESRSALQARLSEKDREVQELTQQLQAITAEADKVRAARDVAAMSAQSAVTREQIRADSKSEEIESRERIAGGQSDARLDEGAQKAAFDQVLQRMEQRHEEKMAELEARLKMAIEGVKANTARETAAAAAETAKAKGDGDAGGRQSGDA